jgi:CubicO group peptidase (beta-lactamase class C family)
MAGCPNLTASEVYDRVAGMNLLYPPGLQPSYSNLGFGILGRSLEGVAGMSWEEYVRRMVAEPLGMVNTHTTIVTENLAVGYTADGSVSPLLDIGRRPCPSSTPDSRTVIA